MIIDTHAHLNFDAYDKDRAEVIQRTLDGNIYCINVGCSLVSSKAAIELAENHEGFWAAVGLHPTDVDEIFNVQDYRDLARSKKVVAIGEIGLDFFRPPFDKEKQTTIFLQQLALAKELDLPVIIHCRAAHDEMIKTLKERQLRGTIHCFTGTWQQAQKYMELGFYLGIGGIIFKFNIDETLRNMPLERLLVETDCPFLSPPMASSKRNEPMFIKHTIQKIAELKGITLENVRDITTENAKRLFKL